MISWRLSLKSRVKPWLHPLDGDVDDCGDNDGDDDDDDDDSDNEGDGDSEYKWLSSKWPGILMKLIITVRIVFSNIR